MSLKFWWYTFTVLAILANVGCLVFTLTGHLVPSKANQAFLYAIAIGLMISVIMFDRLNMKQADLIERWRKLYEERFETEKNS